MTKPFDMALFLNGVLTGSYATRRRHLRQAQIMQAAIQKRWGIASPWGWKLKHLRWFSDRYLKIYAPATRYYFLLTVLLIINRLGRRESWKAALTT